MDNTNQKNVIYGNDMLNTLPYKDNKCLYFNQSQTVNDIRINNVFSQLVNNDLYSATKVNLDSNYTVGPKDKGELDESYDGFKCYDDTGNSELSVLHRCDTPLSGTLNEETVFCSTESFVGHVIYDIISHGEYIYVLAENGVFYKESSGCYQQLFLKSDDIEEAQPLTATCQYHDDSRIYVGGTAGLYKIICVPDNDEKRVYAVKISDPETVSVTSIHFQSETGKLLIGLEDGRVRYGYDSGDESIIKFTDLCDFADMQYSAVRRDYEIINPGKINNITSIPFDQYAGECNSIIVGTDGGMYRNLQAQQATDYSEHAISSFGCASMTSIFQLAGSLHFIAEPGIYCVSENMLSAAMKFSMAGIAGMQEQDDSVFVWTSNSLYSYHYDDTLADFVCTKVIDIASPTIGAQIVAADSICIQDTDFIIVAIGRSVQVYNRETARLVCTLVEAPDDIVRLRAQRSARRVFFATSRSLYRFDNFKYDPDAPGERIDVLEKPYNGDFNRIIVCDSVAGERTGLFVQLGKPENNGQIYRIKDGISSDIGISAEWQWHILDFDVAHSADDSGFYTAALLSGDGDYNYIKIYDGSVSQNVNLYKNMPKSVIHAGKYFVASTERGVYTIDFANEKYWYNSDCPNIVELHNSENDNSIVYGLSSNAVIRLNASVPTNYEQQIPSADTGIISDFTYVFKNLAHADALYCTNYSGLSAYRSDGSKYAFVSAIADGKNTTYIGNIDGTEYLHCTATDIYIRDFESNGRISCISSGISCVGACIDETAQGYYAIDKKLYNLAGRRHYDSVYAGSLANPKNAVMPLYGGTLSDYYAMQSDLCSVIVKRKSDDTTKLEKNLSDIIVGMTFQGKAQTLIAATPNKLYDIVASSNRYYVKALSIDFDGINYFGSMTLSGNDVQVLVHDSRIDYMLSAGLNSKSTEVQNMLTVTLDEGDGGIRHFSTFDITDDGDNVSSYFSFNTDMSVIYRRIISADGALKAVSTGLPGFIDDNLIGSPDEISVQMTFLQDGENGIDRYVQTVENDGTVALTKNGEPFNQIQVDGTTYGVSGLVSENRYGYSENGMLLQDNGIYTGGSSLYFIPDSLGQVTNIEFDSESNVTYVATATHFAKSFITPFEPAEISGAILDGNAVSIHGKVGSIRRMDINGQIVLLAVIDGKAYYSTPSSFLISEPNSLAFTSFCNQVESIEYNGEQVYCNSTDVFGSAYIKKYDFSVKDGAVMAVMRYQYQYDHDHYHLMSVFDLSKIDGTTVGRYDEYLKAKTRTTTEPFTMYGESETYLFGMPAVAYHEKWVACAAWSNDEAGRYGKRCYYLNSEYDIFYLDSDDAVSVELNAESEYGIKPELIKISNGTLFMLESGKWYYVDHNNAVCELNSDYGQLCCVEYIDEKYHYTFRDGSGIYRNTEYTEPSLKCEEHSYDCPSTASAIADIPNIGDSTECEIACTTTSGQVKAYGLDFQQDALNLKSFNGYSDFSGMWVVNDRLSDGRRFLTTSDYVGFKIFESGQLQDVPRFARDVSLTQGASRVLKTGEYYLIAATWGWVCFSGWTQAGQQFRRVGKNTINVRHIQSADSKYLIAASDGQYMSTYRNGSLSIPVKTSTETCDIKCIKRASYGGKIFFVSVRLGADSGVYASDNGLAWSLLFNTPYTPTCVEFVTYGTYAVGTVAGVYSTSPQYTVYNDFQRFGEKDLYYLYENMAGDLSSAYETAYSNHVADDEYGHGPDSIVSLVQDPVSGLMDVGFENFKSGSSVWQTDSGLTETNAGISCRAISNDMVASVRFGSQDDGDVTVNTKNFLLSTDNAQFTYIVKKWMSGLTELYLYLPTTNTYYIDHVFGAPNCQCYDIEIMRKNIQRFGVSKNTIKGDMSKYYTQFDVLLDNVEYNIDCLFDAQANGNSLPLKIYKDTEYQGVEGIAPMMFHSFVQPTLLLSTEINNRSLVEPTHKFSFACFGTDSQAVKITFQDNAAQSGGNTFKIVFNSNTQAVQTVRQIASMDETRLISLKRNTFAYSNNAKQFMGWSWNPNPPDESVPDLYDMQNFCYSLEYMPENIYNSVKSGSSVNLYAIWGELLQPSQSTSLTLKSNQKEFYFDTLIVDTSIPPGENVIIDYGD